MIMRERTSPTCKNSKHNNCFYVYRLVLIPAVLNYSMDNHFYACAKCYCQFKYVGVIVCERSSC